MKRAQRLALWVLGSWKINLCGRCAAQYRQHYALELLRKPVDWKITCEECSRRRYGAVYVVRRK